MSNEKKDKQETAAPEHQQNSQESPQEQQKGNAYPEDLHTTKKPVPDPIPGEHLKDGKKMG